MMRFGRFVLVINVLILVQHSHPLFANHIFFTTRDTELFTARIWRAHLSGTGVKLLNVRSSEFLIPDIEFNPFDKQIYWSEHYGGIWRSDATGAEVVSVLSTVDAHGIAFDSHYMYWGLGVGDPTRIWRADLFLGYPPYFPLSPQPLIKGNSWTADLAIDPVTKKVYWTETSLCGACLGAIWRADTNGANPQLLASPRFAHDVKLDVAHRKMYWTDNGLYRSNLDGTNSELIISGGVRTFTFDGTGDILLYAVGNTIYRANRDGGNASIVLTSAFDIEDIAFGAGAVVPESSTTTYLAAGILVVASRRRRVREAVRNNA